MANILAGEDRRDKEEEEMNLGVQECQQDVDQVGHTEWKRGNKAMWQKDSLAEPG